tara:strand:+ start:9586 stop:10275 length:690 start_codon:yes stop_codon:yes gene_type:complete
MTNFLFHGLALCLVFLLGSLACSEGYEEARTTATKAPPNNSFKILILGDSLTEGYGILEKEAYPNLLEGKLNQELTPQTETTYQVINGGITGATSSGGVSRIDWFLQAQPDFLILALGGNDGLRGVPVSETKENLSKILGTAAKHQIPALLAGMKIPPNYGLTYTSEFAQMYQDLAEHHHIPRIPFLLEGVGGDPKFNLPDRIHPNPAGHEIIAETVYQSLARQLKTIP